MYKYAVMQNPGHNRVYFNASGKLAKNELSALFGNIITEIKEEIFGGIEYLTFEKEIELSEGDIILLSRLSFVYAIFEIRDKVFIPLTKNHSYFFSDDLNMILKYSGKTNEIFTRMMLNLAVFAGGFKEQCLIGNINSSNFNSSDFNSSDFNSSDFNSSDFNLLDPLCGKGTTVFDGLICGYNSYGIDISEKLIGESARFFKKYLETGKYKHTLKEEKISGVNIINNNKVPFKSERHLFNIAKNKEDQKSDKTLLCEFIDGDSVNTGKYYKKNTFHIIAGDLPYGIQHESIAAGGNKAYGNKMRNPANLLNACLPAWTDVLKPGGSVVLAWNTFLLKRMELEKVFAKNNLNIIDFGDFSHRVDQAINRDVIIGVKN